MGKDYDYYTNLRRIFTSQVEKYILGSAVTKIGDYAFNNCSGLTEIKIPSSVSSIGYDAFTGTSLTYATFGCSGEVAKNAVLGSLKEITLTSEVQSFEGYPFNSLIMLEKLNCWADNPPTLTGTQFTDAQFDKLEVHVTPEAFSAYENASVWNLFLNLKGDLVDGIHGIAVDKATAGKTYNLSGQEVGDGFKGIVIVNGKKIIKRKC